MGEIPVRGQDIGLANLPLVVVEEFEVILGSLLILVSFEEEVGQDEVDGEHGAQRLDALLLGIVGTTGVEHAGIDFAVGGHGRAAELHETGSERVADALQVLGLHLAVGISNTGERVGVEGHGPVVLSQLHVGPCTHGQGLGILGDGHAAATCAQGGVAMGNVVVAVVDDAIVEVGRVEPVGGIGGEVGQTAQVGLRVLVGSHEVASHLARHHILVGHLLQALQNAQRVEHGVGLGVKGWVEDLTVGLGLEHVLAGGECCGKAAAHKKGDKLNKAGTYKKGDNLKFLHILGIHNHYQF